MKKKISVYLASFLIISLLFGTWGTIEAAAEGESSVTFTEGKFLQDYEALAYGDGMHGGHQTRTVRTTHGTYIAFSVDEVEDGSGMHEYAILRVDDEGDIETVYRTFSNYTGSSTHPAIFADENENIYMVWSAPDLWDSMPNAEEWVRLHLVAYDHETGVATDYNLITKSATVSGWGYSSPLYDAENNKVYALLAGGSQTQATLCWYIFDLETMTWEPEQHQVFMDIRNGYLFPYVDGNGGFWYVGLQNRHMYDVPDGDNIQHNDWIFDQLNLVHVPDVYKNEYNITPVFVGEYNAENKTCPDIGCNQSGDVYVDTEGYMHLFCASEDVIYNTANPWGYELDHRLNRKSWHLVFDISDPSNPECLYKEETRLKYGTEEDSRYKRKVYESSDGQMWLFAVLDYTNEVEIWKVNKVEGDTLDYEYEYVDSKTYTLPNHNTLDISSKRGGSIQDNIVDVIYGSWGNGSAYSGYTYFQVDLRNLVDDGGGTGGGGTTGDGTTGGGTTSGGQSATTTTPPTQVGAETPTGDYEMPLVWAALTAVAGIALVAVFVLRKKKTL